MEEIEKKTTLLSPTGKKTYKAIKKSLDVFSGKTRPVGARIPIEKYDDLWEKRALHAKENGMSKGEFFVHTLETDKKLNGAFFPAANLYGRRQVDYKDEMVDMIIECFEKINQESWIKESDILHKNILRGTKEMLQVNMKEQINKKGIQ